MNKPKDLLSKYGAMLGVTKTGTQKPSASPKTKTTRTITIYRMTHAYKELDMTGIGNMLKDAFPLRVLLDDQDMGTVPKDGPMVLPMDGNAHYIRSGPIAPKANIPAGTGNYIAYFFNDYFSIGPEEDPFRAGLTEFLLKMFRGKGIRERILDPNNRNKNIKLQISPKGITLSRQLNKTQGLAQWALGGDEEVVTFRQAGVTSPTGELASGYWNFVQMCVEEAILSDKQAGMTMYLGGFTYRSK